MTLPPRAIHRGQERSQPTTTDHGMVEVTWTVHGLSRWRTCLPVVAPSTFRAADRSLRPADQTLRPPPIWPTRNRVVRKSSLGSLRAPGTSAVALWRAGPVNLAVALRHHRRDPRRPLATLGISLRCTDITQQHRSPGPGPAVLPWGGLRKVRD